MIEASGPALRVLPIGGCGEVGLNSTLLLDGDEGLLIDCGILLSLEDAPGVDSAIPDFKPLTRGGRRILGVVLTHGHEDHIGAVPRLLDQHKVPVYGPPLAIKLLKVKMDGEREKLALLHEVGFGERVKIGPFLVEPIRVTHSLPDSAALYIETRAGKVLHSGDYKLDPTPVDGLATDVARLKAIGDAGLDLLMADSTNSERNGRTRPELEVGLELEQVVRESEGLVIVACFASHIHRIQGIVNAAKAAGRRVALVGRAMNTMVEIARREGYLELDRAMLVDEKHIHDLARERVLVLATGTQGEGRAALARMVQDGDYCVRPQAGDRVVLSSVVIPGNTLAVRRVVNAFSRMGVEVIDDRSRCVHCSGHAHREEQADLLRVLRPRHFVPIHGDRAMLEAHGATARTCGVHADRALVIEDGDSVVLADGVLRRGPSEDVSPQLVDGGSGALIDAAQVGDRRKLGFAGMVLCSVALERGGRLVAPPSVAVTGIPAGDGLREAIAAEVDNALSVVKRRAEIDRVEVVKSAIRRAIGRFLRVRPLIRVHVIEVDPLGRRSDIDQP